MQPGVTFCSQVYKEVSPLLVPLQVGQHYLAEGWGQQMMTLADFVQKHMQPNSAAASEEEGSALPSSAPPERVGYLAQHPLFEQVSGPGGRRHDVDSTKGTAPTISLNCKLDCLQVLALLVSGAKP